MDETATNAVLGFSISTEITHQAASSVTVVVSARHVQAPPTTEIR